MPKAESIHEKPTSRSVTMACLGGVAFFLARCTHSPTQRVAELYYSFSPHQHSDPILPDGVYLLSTPMGRDGNPRGKIQPALYQPGHLLAKHHFSSKVTNVISQTPEYIFYVEIFFFLANIYNTNNPACCNWYTTTPLQCNGANECRP